ncbi:NAD(P)-binding protein [Mycena galericulata]|nr:NAD(P)-binding protein [Mycena galericulata]
MPSLSAVKAFNSAFSSPYLPVDVFAYARYTKGKAHIILIGRNRKAAESILGSLPTPSTQQGWKHEFVACDASLMKNNRVVLYLVISSGYASLLGRNETEEGIDHQLALRYYGRSKLLSDFLPALRAANRSGETSKVMSILDPLHGAPVDSNDFGLRLKYSGMAASKASCTYVDMAFEEFALRDPEISFTHIAPGFVNTPMYSFDHMKLALPLIKPLLWTIGEKGFRRGENSDDIGMKKYAGTEEARKKLWEHTVKEVALDGNSKL